MWELDRDTEDTWEVGSLFGGVGWQECTSMAKTSLQYSCSYCSRDGICKVQITSEESRILEEDSEGYCYWTGTAAVGLLVDDVGLLCLVNECREIEERFGTHFTEEILSGEADLNTMKEVVIWTRKRGLSCVREGPTDCRGMQYRWLRLWDMALNLELQHTRSLQVMSRLQSSHDWGSPVPSARKRI